MKKLAGTLAVLLALGVLFPAASCNKSSTKPSGGTPDGGNTQVAISNFAYSSLTVPMGTTVTWKNNDSMAHTATSDTGSAFSFDTGSIASGATSSGITFTQAGTFAYHCTFHSGMHGSITVQ
jgi:plastocyanin